MNELLSRLALAFGIGLLVGLERGWSAREVPAGGRAAGVRTFAIAGLLGGVVGALASSGAPERGLALALPGAILVAAALLAYAAIILAFTRAENLARNSHSATTAIAALLTFVLGVYALVGDTRVATAAAVVTTAILALREGIHSWIAKITRRELESGLLLLAMTFIALPIVPSEPIGPFGGVNLREVWLIAISLAAVSFAAYVAVRYFGERRGLLLSATLGGLVSSTAVALSSARQAAAGQGAPHLLAAGVALSSVVSFVRVAVLVGIFAASLLPLVVVPLAAASLVACGIAFWIVRRAAPPNGDRVGATLRNPFGFWPVLAIAATMGVLILLGRVINERFGARGVLVGAASMGLFDVDAMTVSMARMVPEPLAPLAAAEAILLGVASNTVMKVAIAGAIGRGRFARNVGAIAVGCIAAGAAAFAVQRAIA